MIRYKIEWPGDARHDLFARDTFDSADLAVCTLQVRCTGFDLGKLEWVGDVAFAVPDGLSDADDYCPVISPVT